MDREATIRQSVFRVVEEVDGRPMRLGTAFFVGAGWFLTCRHVIGAHSSNPWQNGQVAPVDLSADTYLEGGLTDPLHQIKWYPYFEEEFCQDFDVAVGLLPTGHSLPTALGVSFDTLFLDQQGLSVYGYGEQNDKSFGYRTRNFAGKDQRQGRIRLDGTCAPGFSGGPVIRNDVAVAIACSDNMHRTVSYAIPLSRIWHWLEHNFPPSTPTPPASGGTGKRGRSIDINIIIRIPLAGGITDLGSGHDLIARHLAEKVFANAPAVKGFIGNVNANLEGTIKGSPDLFRGIKIDPLEIPSGSPVACAQETIALALSKSRRTAAALILTDDHFREEFLDDDLKTAMSEALGRLEKA